MAEYIIARIVMGMALLGLSLMVLGIALLVDWLIRHWGDNMTFEDLSTVNLNWNFETVLRITVINSDYSYDENIAISIAMRQFGKYKVIWFKKNAIMLQKE